MGVDFFIVQEYSRKFFGFFRNSDTSEYIRTADVEERRQKKRRKMHRILRITEPGEKVRDIVRLRTGVNIPACKIGKRNAIIEKSFLIYSCLCFLPEDKRHFPILVLTAFMKFSCPGRNYIGFSQPNFLRIFALDNSNFHIRITIPLFLDRLHIGICCFELGMFKIVNTHYSPESMIDKVND
ncbi:hypothetical protein ES708_10061 [subsurface metagenome]